MSESRGRIIMRGIVIIIRGRGLGLLFVIMVSCLQARDKQTASMVQ